MVEKKSQNPKEVRALLDSDTSTDGFKKLLDALRLLFTQAKHLEPLALRLQHILETAAPVVLEVMSEFMKWNVSSEVLSKSGWLPHYTTPFDYIAKCGENNETIRNGLLNYYKDNWQNVRSEIEARVLSYKIDEEAKATFREALDAHEAGLYRCVCRVLFPEIERVFRTELFDNKIGHIGYKKFIKKLIDDKKSIDAFITEGLYDLSIFGHLIKAIRGEEETTESEKLIFGLFKNVSSEKECEILKQNPIPNRHAVIHGLVTYSSQQNSLNTIFIADYIFRIITPTVSPTSSR